MKPKKQVALKLKTLTLTLGLVAGMSAGTAMGYTAGTEGKKAQYFGENMELFLGHYASDKVYDAFVEPNSVTEDVTGTGAFSGQVTVSTHTLKIDGKKALTKTDLAAMVTAAGVLDTNAVEVLKVFGEGDINPGAGVYAVSAAQTKFEDLNVANDDNTQAKAVMDDVAIELGGVTEEDISNNVSTIGHLDSIDDVNQLVNYFYDAVAGTPATQAGEVVAGGAGLDTKEKRTAFFNYVAAYLDHKDDDVTALTSEGVFGSGFKADDSKLSAVAKKVAGLLTDLNASAVTDAKLPQLTTDAMLTKVIADGYLDSQLEKLETAVSKTSTSKLFTGVLAATDDKKVGLTNEVVEKLVPNARATAGVARGASKNVMQNVSSHQQVMQEGVNSGDSDYADGNVWLRMNYLQQTVDKQDAAPGYKQKSMGFGIGVDQPLNDKFTMGLAYNFVKSDVDGEDGYLKEDDVKSHGFGGYVTMMHDNLFADAQINYVKNKVDGFRKVTADGDKITYKYDGDVLNAMVGLGMHVDLENHWYAKPKLCFAFANYKTDKYDEAGHTLVATDIDAASYQSTEVGLQLTVGADLMMDNYKVMPKLNMGFMYDMNDKKDKVTFAFMGADDFVSEGPKRDRSNFNVGVGAGFMMENVTLNLDYGFNWSSNTKTHGISAKLGYMF